MGAGAALAALPTLGTAAGETPPALTPDETLDAWMRLACAHDDRLVIWWMEGTRYGVVDSRAKALYGMQVGIFQRFFRQPDGYWKLAMFELTYYTDLKTGRLLERWSNPYTGEMNDVRHVRLGPEIRHMTRDGQLANPANKAMQSMLRDYSTSLGPAIVNGGRIWIPTSVEAIIGFPKPTAPDIRLSIYTTASGSLADARNPDIASAPCTLAFQNILKWEPWMNMGDHRGTMMSRAAGQKLSALEQLPATYLEMARAVHPFLIKDPRETLAAKVTEIQNAAATG